MLAFSQTNAQTTSSAGFSLLEILIVLSILLILVTVTISGFSDYARTQQFVRLADEVGHQIRLAKQMTLASKGDQQYGIYVGTSTIELFSGSVPVAGSSTNQIVDLMNTQQTATSSFSDGNWFVTFSRITGEASATGTIVITNAELGRTATYTIRNSGLIE